MLSPLVCFLGAGLGQQDVFFRGMSCSSARLPKQVRLCLMFSIMFRFGLCSTFSVRFTDDDGLTMRMMTEHFVCICSKGPLGGLQSAYSTHYVCEMQMV